MGKYTIEQMGIGKLADTPGFLQMCREYRLESGVPLWGAENVDIASYMTNCRVFGVLHDGALVGVGVVRKVNGVSHYKDLRTAAVDAIFISKAHRKGSLGLKLFNTLKKAAADMGAETLCVTAPYGSRLARMLRVILRGNPTSEVFVVGVDKETNNGN